MFVSGKKKKQVPCKLRHQVFDFYLAAICFAKCFFSRSNDQYHCGQFYNKAS